MLITPKQQPYFYYVAITGFAFLCIALSAMPMGQKMLLSTLVVFIVWVDDARARKTSVQSFKWIDHVRPYWLIVSSNQQYVATLISRQIYRNRYFIILHWALRTPEGLPLHQARIHPRKKFHVLLCRWHYDVKSWRALQVIVSTHPFNKTI